ncbi:MAG: hypothetical protein M0Z49_01225 [Chloroflexi bacterium]|nr:hypothetical protein [Chloroflexota bacterium]
MSGARRLSRRRLLQAAGGVASAGALEAAAAPAGTAITLDAMVDVLYQRLA